MKEWCPSCQCGRIASGQVFCYVCGTALIEREKCVCGELIYSHYFFCPKCGQDIIKLKQAKTGFVECGMTGKMVPPEDTGLCNNAEGCDDCVHNEE